MSDGSKHASWRNESLDKTWPSDSTEIWNVLKWVWILYFDWLPDIETKQQTKDSEKYEVNAIYDAIPIKYGFVFCIEK